jgi:hypothetical protein
MALRCLRRSPASFALVLVVGSTGCGAAGGEQFAEVGSAIKDGELDTGDPAVVALTYQGQTFCSGTLVGPDVVLTAAHCLDPEINPLPLEDFEVFFGNDVTGRGVFIGVTEGGPSPSFVHQDPDFEYHDVGMLRLSETAPVDPLPLPSAPLDDEFIGSIVREVGFGITSADADDAGIKREGTSKVIKFRGTLFRVDPAPSTICSGDSGGPSFATIDGQELVVGVHMGGDCETFAANQRVDLELDSFIQPFLDGSSAVPCSADGYCLLHGCEVADPDCPPPCAAADGTCVVECPAPDPDCAVEDDTCADDPCAAGCPQAAQCAEPVADDAPRASEPGGCALRQPSRTASNAWLGLACAALALAHARSRRRRHLRPS